MAAKLLSDESGNGDGRPQVSVRMSDGTVMDVPLAQMSASTMVDSRPFRTFRWYKGQRHYPGSYWSSTESSHVVYESRLELTRLILADFDVSVTRIFAQPLAIHRREKSRIRRHVPDYLLVRDAELTFVAVKPRHLLDDPKIATALSWAREMIEVSGWHFEIACEPPQPMFDNVRFLAGYRRAQSISAFAVAELRTHCLNGTTFGEAVRKVTAPEPLARAALLHLLWTHELSADLSRVLSDNTVLTAGVLA